MEDKIGVGTVLEGYEFIEPLAEGSQSSVWKVKSTQFDRGFVAKVSFVNDDDVDRVWRVFDSEIRDLTRLDHPNIIKLYAHFRHVTNFVLILEYCPNGSLLSYIQKVGAMRTPVMVRILREVCSALNHAWSHGVQHRDINPANILFDETGRAKVVDFGVSLIAADTAAKSKRVSDFVGYDMCSAPEILCKKKYDPIKADIWALGMTLLWMVKGEMPWQAADREHAIRLASAAPTYIPKKSMCTSLYEVLKKLLAIVPKNRVMPTEDELAKLGDDAKEQDEPNVYMGNESSVQFVEQPGVRIAKPGPLLAGASLRSLGVGRGPRPSLPNAGPKRAKIPEDDKAECSLDSLMNEP